MIESERLAELIDAKLDNILNFPYVYPNAAEALAEYLAENGVSIVVRCKDCEYYIKSCKICKKLSGLKMTIPEFGCVLGKRREG